MSLPVGAAAPELGLRSQHGSVVDLAALRGSPALVVFYPFAFSGVCTSELLALRDRVDELAAAHPGTRLVAVSCDPVYALRVLAERDRIGFDLLSDFWPHGAVSRAYDCFDEASGAPRRSTYLLDAAGRVAWTVSSGVDRARSVDDYLAALVGLGEDRGPDGCGSVCRASGE